MLFYYFILLIFILILFLKIVIINVKDILEMYLLCLSDCLGM